MDHKDEDDKAHERKDPISLEYYIEYLLRILEYACIWPVRSLSPLQNLLSTGVTIFFLLMNLFLLLPEIAALTMSNDLKVFANIIGVIGMHAVGLIKWCYFIWKNREIVDLVKQLKMCHVLCQKINRSEEAYQIHRSEMESARKYSNIFMWCWIFTCIYGVLHWCANPLLLEWVSNQIYSINTTFKQRNLPFIGWYPLNTNDIHNYGYLYIMQVMGGIAPAFGIICYDGFYITMLMVICAQFQFINAILMKNNIDKMPETEAMLTLETELKNCVNCHTAIIKFLKMLQAFSSPTMFVQCIETLAVLCLVSFEASTIEIAIDMESILKLWSLFEYFLCSAFELYVFCLFATQLQFLGLQIAHSVYFCEWENFMDFEKGAYLGKQSRRRNIYQLVQIIMMRAQKPIVLTGGPFYVLSLETFRVIMSMSMSTCVMLRTVSGSNK
ncbi:hypothetical protein PUN28_004480 [Cardiocondyla obscurior]|uniref:Odorant receptor n=2 Tax=Cardiocondyla obscurior TaxID=286306 RepID=A0AAW2GBI4_9HYME